MLKSLAVSLALSQIAPAHAADRVLLRCGQSPTVVVFQGADERLIVDGSPVEPEWSNEGRDAVFVGSGRADQAQHHFEIIPTGGFQLDQQECEIIKTSW